MKKIIAALVLLTSLSASADLGVGALISGQKDSWTASGPGLNSVSSPKMSSRYGALLWFPIFPTLSVRTGYLIENLELESETSLGTFTTTYKNSVVPLNLQFSLPFTGAYIFGGLLFASNFSAEPGGNKLESDQRVNMGAGYEFFSFVVGSLNGELEYQYGTKNLSSTDGFEIKSRALTANLIFKVGF
jgi:hypothetical protein